MGGLNGERIHEASYTNVNQFEEIRGLGMVPSKSLSFVVDHLNGVQNGLKENGHPPCSLVYTDNPQSQLNFLISSDISTDICLQGEQGFHEALTPSLTKDVEHVTLYTDLLLFKTPDTVQTHFTDDTVIMEGLCSDILSECNTSRSNQSDILVIGFSIQLKSTSSGPKLKAVQLRTPKLNLVFDVCFYI